MTSLISRTHCQNCRWIGSPIRVKLKLYMTITCIHSSLIYVELQTHRLLLNVLSTPNICSNSHDKSCWYFKLSWLWSCGRISGTQTDVPLINEDSWWYLFVAYIKYIFHLIKHIILNILGVLHQLNICQIFHVSDCFLLPILWMSLGHLICS